MTILRIRMFCLATAGCILVAGCEKSTNETAAPAAMRGAAPIAGQAVGVPGDQRTIAYRHALTVEIDPGQLEARWARDRKACTDDKAFHCIILDASFQSSGMGAGRPTAHLTFRIAPEGVATFAGAITKDVALTASSLQATDMAASIEDLTRRGAMLGAYRDRLTELSKRTSASVDDLIKLSSELSHVQSQLEEIAGSRAKIAQQVELEQVAVQYLAIRGSGDRLAPITTALANFRQTLGESAGGAIRFVALVVPWLPFAALGIALLYGLVRLLPRRRSPR